MASFGEYIFMIGRRDNADGNFHIRSLNASTFEISDTMRFPSYRDGYSSLANTDDARRFGVQRLQR